MRIEGIAPRTWLLATVAGWAVLLWLLALIGMGENVRRLPDDPAMLARLPQLPSAPAERLGPLSQYAETSARPLFSEDRRPQPFSLTPEGDDNAAPAFDFVLTSVLLTPTLKEAIVQPSAGGESIRIKLGEAAEQQPAWRLATLNPRSAVFVGPEGEKKLDLRVYDGTGGESPTAVGGGQPASVEDASMPSPPPAPKPPVQAPKPATRPAVTPPASTSTTSDTAPNEQAVHDAQIEAIRKRIEERRAQLRQQAKNPEPPAKNP